MIIPLAIFYDPIVQWYASLFIMATMALHLKTNWQLILIFLASIFRINFIIFLLFPLYNFFKDKKIKLTQIIILFIVGGLFFTLQEFQSNHPRNNAQIVETSWFPGNSKSLSDAGFIQGTHYTYSIRNKLDDTDFFFRHKDLFGEAQNMVEMIRANPKVVIENLFYNIYLFPIVFLNQTLLGKSLHPLLGKYVFILLALLIVCLIIFVLKNRLLESRDILFLILSFLITFTMILVWPKDRYFTLFFITLIYFALKIYKKNMVVSLLSMALFFPYPINFYTFSTSNEKYQPIYHSANFEFVKKFDELLAKNNCEEILIHDPSKRNIIEVLSENESRFFITIFSLPPFKKKIQLPRCIYIGEEAYESLKYPSYVPNSNNEYGL